MNNMAIFNEIDMMSGILHELKTPLSVILSTVQLVERQNMYNEIGMSEKYRNTIRQNCYRLLRLVNNMVDLNKISSGYVSPNLSEVDIIYLAEEITQSIVPFAQQKNIMVRFDTEVEELVMAVDIDKIERILLNLLSNAIKFTPVDGNIDVGVRVFETSVYITVTDSGIGIPEEKKAEIFMKYSQVHDFKEVSHKGNGLGLSIVMAFVKLLGGSLTVNSMTGVGTTFTVKLPITHCNDKDSKACSDDVIHERIVESLNIEFSDIYNSQSA